MKKIMATAAFIFTMALGSSALAAGADVANCAHMSEGKGVSACAKEMSRGVSECATSPECPMVAGMNN